MATLLFIFIAFLATAAIVAPIIYFHSRNVLREQKNYERGLKMVPLLIHLPPSSDDRESGGRDERDLVDENISKAQILYTIIASTLQKGFRSKFYGQRHFSFEIIATHGFVKFYAAVPVAMLEVVKQGVISAYPTARLEEVAEHNIFSPVGKVSGTIGGELTLKEPFAYPIATYQDIKRDPMQTLLNSLSTLQKEDGIGIQILLRPADSSWRKKASAIASKKRKGKEDKKAHTQAFWWVKQIGVALWRPPEYKEGDKKDDKPDLSNLDQAVLDAIDDKTRHAGYETLVRVVASSNISQRAQAILSNVVAAFALFDAPGKNGFKYTPAKDMEEFVTAFIMRFFPQQSNQNILNAVELATIFHFPDQKNIPTSQLERQSSKQVDAPRNLPAEGLFLGYNIFRGVKKPVRLSLMDRQRHMYVVGQTGVGKSTFMENLAFQDMLNGDGFAYIDPHGDSAELLMSMVPKERTEDVTYFCPADMDYPLGLNMFEFNSPEQKDFLIQEALNMLYKLYDPQKQGIIGPRFERIFTNSALLLMADPRGGTFVDIPKLLIDANFMKDKLKYVTDQNVMDFWTKEWPNSQRSNEAGEVTSWVVSKFGAFLSNEMMRNIIGQNKSSFDLRQIMDNKKILIVNLSKGRTGDINSRLLGMIFVMKFQAAAMSRASIPEKDRQDFCLYVDEFQNFSTDSFATIMSEARKYHLNLVVANQFTTQLTEEIRDAVFGNMGTIVAFRVGQNDVEMLSKYFQPLFDPDDLLRVPNYNAIVRTLISGVPTQSFSMATVPTLGKPNKKLSSALKQLSAAKYGRPKAKVESEIFARLATNEPSRPAAASYGNASQPTAASMASGSRPAMPSAGKASFLDEWLAKKQTGNTVQGSSAARSPMARQASSPPPYSAQPQSHVTPSLQEQPAVKSTPAVSLPSQQAQHTSPIDLGRNPSVSYGTPPSSSTSNGAFDATQVSKLADNLSKTKEQTSGGHIPLHSSDNQATEDTIFIDREGNLSNKTSLDKSE